MKFEWDEAKRKSNINKYGFDFADAYEVFDGVTLTMEDNRFSYVERRFITLGMLKNKIIVIAHTHYKNTVRIISMRKATKNEQKLYFRGFSN